MSMLGPYASYNAESGWASWNPGVEYVGIFDRHGFKPKGVIHVGMWDFVEHECYTKLFGTNVVGVEANPHTFNTMSKPVADKYHFKAYNYAAYFMDGSTIGISLRGGESSVFDAAADTVQVPTITLDTLIQQENIDMSNFDFLNIDAEGAELVVLLGIEENLEHINYIDLEASYQPRHSSGITYDTLTEYLNNRSFYEVEKSDSFDTLGWGDVLFARK